MTLLRHESARAASGGRFAWAALCLVLCACDSNDDKDASKDSASTHEEEHTAGSHAAGSGGSGSKESGASKDNSAGKGGSSSQEGSAGKQSNESQEASAGKGGSPSKENSAGKGGSPSKENAAGMGGSASMADAAGAGGSGGSGGPEAPKLPVVSAVWVRGADVNQTYLMASADMPRGMVDLSKALELPDGTLTSYGKAVFFLNWEDNTIERYEVAAGNKLERTGRVSFANYGIMNAFSWNVLFFSAERAYYVDPEGARVLVWNPKAMEIIEERPAPALAKMGFSMRLGKSHHIGDRFIVSALRSNEDDTDIDRHALALVFKDDAAAPVQIIEDTRCPGTGTSFADDAGDVYMLGDAYGGYMAIGYGLDIGSPCVLRIKKGEDKFDPDYRFDVGEVADARTVQGLWHVTQHKFVVQAWPKSVDPKPIITEPDAYWTADVLKWKLIDLDAKTATDVKGIEDSAPYQLIDFRVDGVTHLLKHEDLTTKEAGQSTLFALKQSAEAEEVAKTDGDFWFIARLTEEK